MNEENNNYTYTTEIPLPQITSSGLGAIISSSKHHTYNKHNHQIPLTILSPSSPPPPILKNSTVSNFKKCDVIKELVNSCLQTKIENALYWSCELICSCYYVELWECIISFFSKHIQVSNPKLVIYLNMRFDIFKCIYNDDENDIQELKNEPRIRKLFTEIICILCLSKKSLHTFQEIKIKDEEFNITNITNKIKSPRVYIDNFLVSDEDPQILQVPINEFIYNILDRNSLMACYWFEYVIEYEILLKRKGELCFGSNREFPNVVIDAKLQTDIIWIFWEILLYYSRENKLLYKITENALQLFCIRYKNSMKKKRKYLLYFIITLLTDTTISSSIYQEIINENDKEIIYNAEQKIDKVYDKILKNCEVGDIALDDFNYNNDA